MKGKIAIFTIVLITIIQNIYASNMNFENIEGDTIYREYIVEKGEKDTFYDELDKVIIRDDKEYKKSSFKLYGGNQVDTITISNIKEVVTQTNSLDEILSSLPQIIEYNQDGYVGENRLDINNIEIQKIDNGYYEEYVEETKQYFDLDKNDMNYIIKEIEKDGIKLYLMNVKWYPQTTKYTGNSEITDLYRGEAYYKGIKRIDNPSTYRVIGTYTGTAIKQIEKPYSITVQYSKVESVEKAEEINSNLPIIISTTGIFIIVIIFCIGNKRVKVFNLQYGKYKYLGKYKIINATIELDKKSKVASNRYQFILNDRAYKKYKGTDIKIICGTTIKSYHINNDKFEINM